MKKYLVVIICFYSLLLQAQNPEFGKEWIVGGPYNYKVTFDSGISISDTMKIGLYFMGGASSICDSSGNLVLVTNGQHIFDKNLNIIDNGTKILDHKFDSLFLWIGVCPQTSIILPFDNNIYYVINSFPSDTMLDYWYKYTGKLPFDKLEYSIVDMKANGGLGKVVQKKIPMVEGRLLSKTQMMACKHANGKDWWLLKVAHDTTKILTFLATQNGIEYKGDFSFDNIVMPGYTAQGLTGIFDSYGQLTFSSDGKKIATTVASGHSELFMADFDRCTGIINNPKHQRVPLNSTYNPPEYSNQIDSSTSGLCFSPNGRFLYVLKSTSIWQWDLTNNDSATAWYEVANLDTTLAEFNGYENLYLAYNNKIYIGYFGGGGDGMSSIDNPNELAIACNFCKQCLKFEANGIYYPPCMPNWNLGAMSCDSEVVQPPLAIDEPILIPNAFSPNGDGKNDTWHILNISQLQLAGITFQGVGVYNRWGNEVFNSNDINFVWHPPSNLASDSYYYYIRFRTKTGTNKVQKGSVSVVR
jgi:gliding motility-associated-like protein